MTSAPGKARPAQRSLWEATAVAARTFGTLHGPLDAQVCVVGAGFSGLSCALHLAERGVSVALLEAGAIGEGASGRNGGQVLPGARQPLGELVAAHGEAAGRRLYQFGAGTADATFEIIRRHGLDCDALQAGWVHAADTQVGLTETMGRMKTWMATGVAAQPLDRAALAAVTGTEAYLGGWLDPRGGSVQPLSLVRELARVAALAGAHVHTQSPAMSMHRSGAGWTVVTPQGSVNAQRVLLATNGRPGGLWPALERTVLPVWSFQVATDPLPDGAGVLPGGPVVSDTRRILRYFRRDRDGRLVVGGKGTIRAPRGPQSFELQRQTLARLYPQLAGMPLRFWWGGRISITFNRYARLFAPAGVNNTSVLAHVACNGKGVAWNVAAGPVLADAMTGVPIEQLALPPLQPLQSIPLHGLRQAYTAAGGAWYRLLDSLER